MDSLGDEQHLRKIEKKLKLYSTYGAELMTFCFIG
jgi:hypothetical protein